MTESELARRSKPSEKAQKPDEVYNFPGEEAFSSEQAASLKVLMGEYNLLCRLRGRKREAQFNGDWNGGATFTQREALTKVIRLIRSVEGIKADPIKLVTALTTGTEVRSMDKILDEIEAGCLTIEEIPQYLMRSYEQSGVLAENTYH